MKALASQRCLCRHVDGLCARLRCTVTSGIKASPQDISMNLSVAEVIGKIVQPTLEIIPHGRVLVDRVLQGHVKRLGTLLCNGEGLRAVLADVIQPLFVGLISLLEAALHVLDGADVVFPDPNVATVQNVVKHVANIGTRPMDVPEAVAKLLDQLAGLGVSICARQGFAHLLDALGCLSSVSAD